VAFYAEVDGIGRHGGFKIRCRKACGFKSHLQHHFSGLEERPMRNTDYWRGRFSILEDSAHREAQKTIQDMEELYLDAQRSVQKEIESWYARFAVNNQISLTDARKWLTAGQLEEFHWSVEQYIKIGEQAGLDAAWLKKLENASARFHISRLEAVQTGIQQQLELLYGNQVDSLLR
jgi:hypothetical protein